MINLHTRRGWTLVELILVVLILAILSAIVLPRITYTVADAKKSACQANRAAINAQTELYHQLTGSWPANDLSDIGANKDYFPEGIPVCPVDGTTAYELDGTTHRVKAHTHGPFTP